jgi:hypothetical protein
MTPRLARTAAAPLVYWLVLLAGLTAAHRVFDLAEPAEVHAVWAAAIGGTILGQLLAWRRVSLWVVMLVVPGLVAAAVPLGVALLRMLGPPILTAATSAHPRVVLELLVEAFVPAALCGYASLSERGALAALWFPTSLWMLGILEGAGHPTLAGEEEWMLLAALAALFVAFLYARESRRVELWRTHAAVRLSTPKAGALLRRAPLRTLAQVGWAAATGVAALLLTAWIAPHLWQNEAVASEANASAASGMRWGLGPWASGAPLPCCPVSVDVPRHRLRQYLPLPLQDEPAGPAASACRSCREELANQPDPTAPGTADESDPGALSTTTSGPVSLAAGAPDPRWSTPRSAAADVVPPPLAPSEPETQEAGNPLDPAGTPSQTAARPGEAPFGLGEGLAWLATLMAAWLALQLVLRPLRRAVMLLHLEHPLYPEPVDQRVSNLWQLVLIGLSDAGWVVAPGEQPQELARRVSLPGMEVCAGVLERARHGLRVDGADLTAMSEAARVVYRAARNGIGPLLRAASWLRWPLV